MQIRLPSVCVRGASPPLRLCASNNNISAETALVNSDSFSESEYEIHMYLSRRCRYGECQGAVVAGHEFDRLRRAFDGEDYVCVMQIRSVTLICIYFIDKF